MEILILRNRGLAFKLCVYILSLASLIYLIIFFYFFNTSKKIVIQSINKEATILSKLVNRKIGQVFVSAEGIAKTISAMMSNSSFSREELQKTITAVVDNHNDIYGSCIAFAPYMFSKNTKLFAPYACKYDGTAKYMDLSKSYDYQTWEWYSDPCKLNKPVWTEPYFDEGAGNIIMSTFSVPFYYGDKSIRAKLRGISTVDISLEWLKNYVSSIKSYGKGYAFLISKTGKIISFPDSEYIMKWTIQEMAENMKDRELASIGQSMLEGKTGFVKYYSNITNSTGWFYYTPLDVNDWSLGIFYPENEFLAGIRKDAGNIIIFSIIGLLLLFIIIIIVTSRITQPLRLLVNATDKMSSGEFTGPVEVLKNNDEIGKLSKSFEFMRLSLIEYIDNLKKTTSAKEKIESELNVARKIQMSIIPRTFPAFPHYEEFEIFAIIKPAKAVGGDMYDFFLLDDNKLCFVIGDVSGKGVPAALFMAVTRTLLRAKAHKDISPGEILSTMNIELCIDNELAMFVTMFLCILNIKTGELSFSNAGHNKPFIIRDGSIDKIDKIHGPPLGVLEGSYDTDVMNLNFNDKIVLYTDGITEALGKNNEEFRELRLLDILYSERNTSSRETVSKIVEKVSIFTNGIDQSDDITVEVLQYKNK